MTRETSVNAAKAIAVNYDNLQLLKKYFMPHVKGGGLLIEVSEPLPMDTEVLLMVSLPDGQARTPVSGKVVWITPPNNKDTLKAIIGVQFSEDRSGLWLRINNLLLSCATRTESDILSF
jgi:type IV pilus assembly protein PilZ